MAIHGTIEQTHLDAILADRNSRIRNSLGFNSSTTLAQARTTFSNIDSLYLNRSSLTSNKLSSMFSWVTAVDDNFYLMDNYLTNVDGLSSLTSVGGSFLLYSNALTNVDGLSSLTSVGESFRLFNNYLTNVDGLSSLTSTGELFELSDNNLTNLNGLSSLTSLGGRFSLSRNSLTDVTGVAWETLTPSFFYFVEALADDADIASVLAPILGNKVSHVILREVLSNYPDYPLLAKPDNYIQEDEPTDVKEGDLWFNPTTCELKIFTE